MVISSPAKGRSGGRYQISIVCECHFLLSRTLTKHNTSTLYNIINHTCSPGIAWTGPSVYPVSPVHSVSVSVSASEETTNKTYTANQEKTGAGAGAGEGMDVGAGDTGSISNNNNNVNITELAMQPAWEHREAKADAVGGLFDPGSYGQYLGGTQKKRGNDKKYR